MRTASVSITRELLQERLGISEAYEVVDIRVDQFNGTFEILLSAEHLPACKEGQLCKKIEPMEAFK